MRALWSQASSARSAINSTSGRYRHVAARMVGMSGPGSVAVTKEIFEHVVSAFDGESLGELNVKGKGEISIFGLRSHKK